MIAIKTKHFEMNIKNSEDIDLLEKEVREINKLKRQAIDELDRQNRIEFSKFLDKEYEQWLAQKELGVVPEDKPSPDFEHAVKEVFNDQENKNW